MSEIGCGFWFNARSLVI